MLGRTPHTPRRDAAPGRPDRDRPDRDRLDRDRPDRGLDRGRSDAGRPDRDRLDPVRWRPPGRGTLIRLVAVTVLLGTAALAVWDRPPACRPERAASSPSCRSASTAAPGTNDAPATSTAGTGATHPDGTGTERAGTTDAGTTDAGTTNAGTTDAGTDGAGTQLAGTDGVDADGVGPPRWAVPPGTVGVPVQLVGPVAVRLLRPGDRVDLFAVDSPGAAPAPVAQDALVLAVTGADDTDGGLLVALRPDGAGRARNTPHRTGYDVLLRPR